MAVTKREGYELTRSSLIQERSSYLDHWRQISQYMRPRRTRFELEDHNKGDRRNTSIIDSTATFCARTLQSGMHAGVTSPARPWVRLGVNDPDLAEHGPVKDWLHTVTRRMLTVFLKSNLYNALPTLYGDAGTFATGAMALLEDDRDLMRCYTYPVGSYALGVSARQVIDTFVREFPMTVRQIVESYARIPGTVNIEWKHISLTVKRLWDKGDYETQVPVCWIIAPNPDHDPQSGLAKYAPFASCIFEKGSDGPDTFLRESGFQVPIMAPRWDVLSEEIYGSECPGMISLGDTKALQLMQRRKAQAIEKMINPPLTAPTSARNQKVSLLPGDISYADESQSARGIRPIHEVSLSVRDLTGDIQDVREMIRNAFYANLFLMLAESDRRQITAREVDERHEEKLLALGPVLERLNDELLDPVVDRTYSMMDRAGMIPEPPEELKDMALRVEYLGLLSQAQKLVGVAGQDRFFRSVEGLAVTFPHVKHKVDAFQGIDDYADMIGINPRIVISDDEAYAALEAEQKALAAAAAKEQMAMESKGIKDLAGAQIAPDNALGQMVGA